MDIPLLFAWPDELRDHSRSGHVSRLDQVLIHLRLQESLLAERELNALAVSDVRCSRTLLSLLRSFLLIQEHCYLSAEHILRSPDILQSCSEDLLPLRNLLLARLSISSRRLPSGSTFGSEFWGVTSAWQPLQIVHAHHLLLSGNLDAAQNLFDSISQPYILEARLLQAALFVRHHHYSDAIACLQNAADRFPQHRELSAQYVNTLLEARSQQLVLPALRHALSLHGEHASLLGAVCTVKLLQRQPSLARRAAFIQRLRPEHARQDASRLSNVLVTYEQTGHADWLAHLTCSALKDATNQLPIQENRCLQLASAQSPLVADQVRSVLNIYGDSPIAAPFAQSKVASLPRTNPLRIGWISGDVCHHPVTRFLLGFFEASSHRLDHQHVLVNLRDHLAESYLDRFYRYTDLQHIDASVESPSCKVEIIRDAQLDVAIDLSGWTGGHFMRGFMTRLAPLQVNYLGYFASTGLPTMDAWIGDSGLFPTPMQEWHSEQIQRLSRCFIAWQPSQQLDEAHEPVTDAPTGGIRFGCFNHNRKLSDTVLRLWGDLLTSVPGSSLVLKANASADPYTQTLLVRRMRRAGLDPDRVIWLPLAGTHREHLQQYRHVDVALDSFPNGGCTTTCEALWMGVPVITLTGTHYVSRMSTAVLQGAGMADWCASSTQHYVSLAKQQADRLSELRQNRDRWRSQVLHHPLGDAADLMHHLEHALVELHSTALTAQASR
jgi:protein O-GlcNAc transferase